MSSVFLHYLVVAQPFAALTSDQAMMLKGHRSQNGEDLCLKDFAHHWQCLDGDVITAPKCLLRLQRTDPWRFGVRMGYKLRKHWRKSSQWFALTRKHAEAVMRDSELLPVFQQHCQNAWDNDLNRHA